MIAGIFGVMGFQNLPIYQLPTDVFCRRAHQVDCIQQPHENPLPS
jgi:hypothetical protein